MKSQARAGIVVLIALAVAPVLGHADPPFHLSYRVDDVRQDGHTRSGTLLLNVYNTSGEHALDMVAWIPEPNQVTYGHRQIGIGTVPDGEQVQILNPYIVPIEAAQTQSTTEAVIWRLEYTRAVGERESVDVVGQEVP